MWNNKWYDDDTVSKYAQNTLPWVLPDKYITDWPTVQLILSLPTLFSLFLPSTNSPLFEKGNVLFSLMTNNPPMNRLPISNSTYVQIATVKYFPLLCRIWPDFVQKSSLFCQQSLGMIQTRVPIFLKSLYSLDDKIRTTEISTNIHNLTFLLHRFANYIHRSMCLLSLFFQFTFHNSHPKLFYFVRFSSEAELQIFLLRIIAWVRSDWAPM